MGKKIAVYIYAKQKGSKNFFQPYPILQNVYLPIWFWLISTLMCFSDNNFSVHIRRSDQFEADKFEASYVTPQLLQKVFELESLPEFLKTESDSQIVPIIPSALRKNDFYIIKGPGEEVKGDMKILKNRATGDDDTSGMFFTIFNLNFLLYNKLSIKLQSWMLNIKKLLWTTKIFFCLHLKISANCSLKVLDTYEQIYIGCSWQFFHV